MPIGVHDRVRRHVESFFRSRERNEQHAEQEAGQLGQKRAQQWSYCTVLRVRPNAHAPSIAGVRDVVEAQRLLALPQKRLESRNPAS